MSNKTLLWMPVHNEEQFIAKAIESILAQSHNHFGLLISDNYSTDSTPTIIKEYAQKDPRIFIIKPPEFMPAMAHNAWLMSDCLSKLNFKYSCLVGGHDIMEVDYLKELFSTAEQNTDCAIAYGRTICINELDAEMYEHKIFINDSSDILLALRPLVILTSIGFNVYMAGLWREEFRKKIPKMHVCTASDHLLITEMAIQGKFIFTDTAKFYLREIQKNTGGGNYLKRHLGSLDQGAKQDFATQLRWASDIVERACNMHPKHPLLGQPVLSSMIQSATLSAYIIRYLQPVGFHEDGIGQLFQDDLFKEIVASNLRTEAAVKAFCG